MIIPGLAVAWDSVQSLPKEEKLKIVSVIIQAVALHIYLLIHHKRSLKCFRVAVCSREPLRASLRELFLLAMETICTQVVFIAEPIQSNKVRR
jgi:hypothetical protein